MLHILVLKTSPFENVTAVSKKSRNYKMLSNWKAYDNGHPSKRKNTGRSVVFWWLLEWLMGNAT